MGVFSGLFDGGPTIEVRVLLRGRIGEGWHDVDRTFKVPLGTTLDGLLDAAEKKGVLLRAAIADSPHLRDTLMLNGERCALDANHDRELHNGDEIYLLAPVAGG